MPEYGAIIAGTGSYLPEKRLTNDELSKMVDTNDEWIVQRTGIRERRIAGTQESTATLAQPRRHAAPLQAAGLEAEAPRPDHLSRPITPEMAFPIDRAASSPHRSGWIRRPHSTSPRRAAGFIYALEIGAAFIKCGTVSRTCW